MKELILKELEKYEWPNFEAVTLTDDIIEIRFDKCIIEFYYNKYYESINCSFYEPQDPSIRYTLREVLERNGYDNSELLHDHSSAELAQYAQQYISLIHSELITVVKGDFSWAALAKQERINFGKIATVMKTIDIINTDIYKKMKSVDKSWEDDLKNLNS